jgi:hypothetical protein
MKKTLDKDPKLGEMLRALDFDKHINELVSVGVRQLSWNHAKIFAINGKCIYTGGTNFYTEYGTFQDKEEADHTRTRVDHNIVDHGVKLVGDAAVAGHKWADYFWQ